MRDMSDISIFSNGNSHIVGTQPTTKNGISDQIVKLGTGYRTEGTPDAYASGTLNSLTAFCVEGWVKSTYGVNATPGKIMQVFDTMSGNRWFGEYFSDGVTNVMQFHQTASAANYIAYTISLAANEDHHWAFIFDISGIDGGADIMQLRLDDVVVGNKTAITLGTPVTSLEAAAYNSTEELTVHNYAKTKLSDRFIKATNRRRS